ncbi:MAG: hypothetical protein H0X07_04970 [Gemmatimonadales bacterium]|nr:hypothetical protein [Gemmatimonadales bacterium]
MQPVPADAERILPALLRSRGKPVERHGDLEAEPGHSIPPMTIEIVGAFGYGKSFTTETRRDHAFVQLHTN